MNSILWLHSSHAPDPYPYLDLRLVRLPFRVEHKRLVRGQLLGRVHHLTVKDVSSSDEVRLGADKGLPNLVVVLDGIEVDSVLVKGPAAALLKCEVVGEKGEWLASLSLLDCEVIGPSDGKVVLGSTTGSTLSNSC